MRRVRRWVPIAFMLTLAGCGDETPQEPEESPGLEVGSVFRNWSIYRLANDPAFDSLLTAGAQEGGVVDVVEEIGGLVVRPPDVGPTATAEVFSNETGQTFWVSAQAPAPDGLAAPDSAVGSESKLGQVLRFRKDAEDASLRFIITQVQLEAIDDNASEPTHAECPWWVRGVLVEFAGECAELMKGEIEATYYAYTDPTRTEPLEAFYFANATAKLFGWGAEWYPDVYTGSLSVDPLFRSGDFDFEMDTDGSGRHPRIRLDAPVAVDIPLDSVDAGEAFEVVMKVRATVRNRRQRESYLAAYFRDPATSDGLTVEYDGLTLLPAPDEIPDDVVWSPAPAPPCEPNAAAGAGGTIAFETAAFLDAEWPGGNTAIAVTRTGGSAGPASVVFAAGDGTATAGSDYQSVTTLILFADGEEGRRAVPVPILTDDDEEADETVMLSLTSPGGCATLGLANAELTILDDDQPPPAEYTVGGTVTGLEGTGLELRNIAAVIAITDNGPFAFPVGYPPGRSYDVTVDQQPSDPLQACTVTNGQGTIADQDVTDILVTCVTPSSDLLDPGFGTGGIVKVDIGPDSDDRIATALALQADGKILAVGRNTLVRYNADGTLDTGFGTNGEVAVSFGTGDTRLYDVAVQPDGRILVAGGAVDPVSLPADDDFGLARFEADGAPDAGFGNGGVVTTDFDGRIDAAYDILIQPDGAIVLAGLALVGAGIDSEFALARYTSAGVPDSTFGADGDGTATVDLAGDSDIGYAAALQSDGKIVVVGRAAPSGGSDPDIGVARFDASGILDSSFGSGGIVRVPTADAEWALDVAVDASDRILVSGSFGTDAFVARYDANGAADAGFGGGMVVSTLLSGANGIALDDTGRILIVGEGDDDFGVVRLLDDGTVDTDFGTDGLVTADFFGGLDVASDVVIQPIDGKMVVGGWITDSGLPRVGLIRVLP
ncbi:MAG TPA: Calx-beta domain-containing protein [Longimicrobiales bacterium]